MTTPSSWKLAFSASYRGLPVDALSCSWWGISDIFGVRWGLSSWTRVQRCQEKERLKRGEWGASHLHSWKSPGFVRWALLRVDAPFEILFLAVCISCRIGRSIRNQPGRIKADWSLRIWNLGAVEADTSAPITIQVPQPSEARYFNLGNSFPLT